jgi:hypothetical protein
LQQPFPRRLKTARRDTGGDNPARHGAKSAACSRTLRRGEGRVRA